MQNSPVSTNESSDSTLIEEERSKDQLYFVLSNYRRRFILDYLAGNPGPVSLRTLSEELAAWENESDTNSITSNQRKRAYVSLRQTHLPKLQEMGIISFDPNRGIVEAMDQMETTFQFLSDDSETEQSSRRTHLWLGLAGMLIFAIMLTVGIVFL